MVCMAPSLKGGRAGGVRMPSLLFQSIGHLIPALLAREECACLEQLRTILCQHHEAL